MTLNNGSLITDNTSYQWEDIKLDLAHFLSYRDLWDLRLGDTLRNQTIRVKQDGSIGPPWNNILTTRRNISTHEKRLNAKNMHIWVEAVIWAWLTGALLSLTLGQQNCNRKQNHHHHRLYLLPQTSNHRGFCPHMLLSHLQWCQSCWLHRLKKRTRKRAINRK